MTNDTRSPRDPSSDISSILNRIRCLYGNRSSVDIKDIEDILIQFSLDSKIDQNNIPPNYFDQVRLSIFYISVLLGILGPIVAAIIPHFLFETQNIGSLYSSSTCVVISIISYLIFKKSQKLDFASGLLAMNIVISYTFGFAFSGGLKSSIIVFAPLIPVLVGLLMKTRGVVWATATLIFISIFIPFINKLGWITLPVQTFSEITINVELVASLFFVGVLIYAYEYLNGKNQTQILSTHEALKRDIEERKKVEIALKNAQSLLSTVLENLPVAVFGKDIKNDYRWSLWNKQAEHLFGISSSECLGKTDFDFFPEKHARFFREKDIEASKYSGVIVIPEEEVDIGGKLATLQTKKVVIKDDSGKPSILLGITEDITNKKQRDMRLDRKSVV